jgi:predicted membrane protein
MNIKKETIVHLFHILIIGSLFIYVGTKRESLPKQTYSFLLGLGATIILYHTYKAYTYSKEGKPIWVNLIHIFLIGPLLVYIGYNREKTTRKFFEMLLMLAFASIGYHSYYLL